MSPPEVPARRLIVKPDARRDISYILLYSRRLWGIEQRGRYRERLYRVMTDLTMYPEMGASGMISFQDVDACPLASIFFSIVFLMQR